MKKLLFQFLATVILFFATWFVLNKIDWVSLLNVKQNTQQTEEKLGDLFWELVERTEDEIHSASALSKLDSLLEHICESNGIEKSKIKLHLIRKDEINAFALPNNHLVIYSGLIEESESEAELCGVMGHEIAHLEKNHVMKKLAKELGLSVLISITAGNGGGGEILKEALATLSSTAYDRTLESEADMTAVDYLIKAKIDPEPLANFLFRLSQATGGLPKQLYWISTHPDSEDRAKEILNYIKNKDIEKNTVLDAADWEDLKAEMQSN